MDTAKFRQMIVDAGAEFVGVFGNKVRFCDAETGAVLSLYTFSCTPENIRLTLKDTREKVPPLLPAEAE